MTDTTTEAVERLANNIYAAPMTYCADARETLLALAARVAECDADKALLFQCEDWLERADKARLEAVAERDTLNARVAELEAALMEVLAFHAQVAHGSVNLTSLSLTMNRAETALQEKTDDQ
jgi:BMFP domain-containing protein YqiC